MPIVPTHFRALAHAVPVLARTGGDAITLRRCAAPLSTTARPGAGGTQQLARYRGLRAPPGSPLQRRSPGVDSRLLARDDYTSSAVLPFVAVWEASLFRRPSAHDNAAQPPRLRAASHVAGAWHARYHAHRHMCPRRPKASPHPSAQASTPSCMGDMRRKPGPATEYIMYWPHACTATRPSRLHSCQYWLPAAYHDAQAPTRVFSLI